MLNIGDFARFAGVSVRMLRHYDAVGLLTPTEVDPHSGYRRYDESLLRRAHQLVALKELGFSLEVVGEMLDAPPGLLQQRLEERRGLAAARHPRGRPRPASPRHVSRGVGRGTRRPRWRLGDRAPASCALRVCSSHPDRLRCRTVSRF